MPLVKAIICIYGLMLCWQFGTSGQPRPHCDSTHATVRDLQKPYSANCKLPQKCREILNNSKQCFINTVIQILYIDASFRDFITSVKEEDSKPVTKLFKDIFRVMDASCNECEDCPVDLSCHAGLLREYLGLGSGGGDAKNLFSLVLKKLSEENPQNAKLLNIDKTPIKLHSQQANKVTSSTVSSARSDANKNPKSFYVFIARNYGKSEDAGLSGRDKVDIDEIVIVDGKKYELTSVAVHSGRVTQGHYYNCVKGKDGAWLKLNNEDVTKMTEEEKLASWPGGPGASSSVNILQYQAV